MAHTSWGEPHHACKEIRRGRQQGCTSQIAAASWLVKSQPLTYTCVARSSWLGWVFKGGVPSRERGTSLLLVADLEKALPTPKTSDTLLPAPPAADKRNYSARVLGSGWLTEGSFLLWARWPQHLRMGNASQSSAGTCWYWQKFISAGIFPLRNWWVLGVEEGTSSKFLISIVIPAMRKAL